MHQHLVDILYQESSYMYVGCTEIRDTVPYEDCLIKMYEHLTLWNQIPLTILSNVLMRFYVVCWQTTCILQFRTNYYRAYSQT